MDIGIALVVACVWCGALALVIATKHALLLRTWREPYLADRAVLIESDDWGPGPDWHASRLSDLCSVLGRHVDSVGRPAVLTADVVLSVPDAAALRGSHPRHERRFLDFDFPAVHAALRRAMTAGLLVPQLHGLEHCFGPGLAALAARGDPRIAVLARQDDWWDWEALDSPLQGHYVDGTSLPTRPLSESDQIGQIKEAVAVFARTFGFRTTSAVAPCYLWDDTTERLWSQEGIRFIQTAGYRCTSRDAGGRYVQDPPLLRVGDRSGAGQRYLVRTAMYEPVDGRGTERCLVEARQAWRQGLPAVISTHRYNYTRSEEEHQASLAGLDRVLTVLGAAGRVRYLSSPELGAWIAGDAAPLTDPASGRRWPALTPLSGLPKVAAWLARLWIRHPKLRVIACASGLIVPIGLLCWLSGAITPVVSAPEPQSDQHPLTPS